MEKLTHLGEKTLKTNPGPPGWGLDTGLATQFWKNKFCHEISVMYSWLDAREDVMEDLKKLKVKNWKEIAQDRRT